MTRGGARLPLIVVLAATALAAALRLPFLAHQSLWMDETFTDTIVAHRSIAGVLSAIRATESTPPLYYLLTWAWTHLVGDESAAMLRAPGAVAGVLSVPAAYLALRRLIGSAGAMAAAVLVATSPLLVYYSLDARAYSLLVLTSILSLWALGALLEAPSRRRWAAWTLAAAALCWTHYFGAFVVLGEVVVLWWRLPQSRTALAAAVIALAIVVAPLAPLFAHQQASSRTAFIAKESLSGRLEQAVRQFAMGPNVPSALLEGAGLLLAAGGLIVGAAGAWRAGKRSSLVVLGVVILAGLVLPVALSLTRIDDVFYVRNVLGIWIVVAAVAALGLIRARGIPLALYAVLGTVAVLWVQAAWQYENVDWHGAISRLGPSVRGEPVVVYGAQGAPVVALYLHRRTATRPLAARAVWVLVSSTRISGRALQPVGGTPAPGILGPPFRAVGGFTYHGVRAIHLEAPRPTAISPASLGVDSADGTAGTLLEP
jgi:uncharacterized membrane protein